MCGGRPHINPRLARLVLEPTSMCGGKGAWARIVFRMNRRQYNPTSRTSEQPKSGFEQLANLKKGTDYDAQ